MGAMHGHSLKRGVPKRGTQSLLCYRQENEVVWMAELCNRSSHINLHAISSGVQNIPSGMDVDNMSTMRG